MNLVNNSISAFEHEMHVTNAKFSHIALNGKQNNRIEATRFSQTDSIKHNKSD